MRVTENTNYNLARETIRRSKERMEGLQQQNATLKKLNTPSDDPVGAAKVLEVRTEKVNNDQMTMNAKLAQTYLENSDHALSELSEIAVRAKEIALSQSSDASSNESSRMGVVEEVTQLFNQAVAAANRKVGDRFLFGGYQTGKAPVDNEGHYVGDDGQMMVEVAKDVFLSMNVPGIEIFNTNPKSSNDAQRLYNKDGQRGEANRAPAETGSGEIGQNDRPGAENVNLFSELQGLRIALISGDTDAVRTSLDRFDQIHGKIVSVRSKVGSRVQGLVNTGQATERHNLTNAQLTSQLEDADMSQVVSDLAKEEMVLRSSLQSSQKLLQPKLLDFLK